MGRHKVKILRCAHGCLFVQAVTCWAGSCIREFVDTACQRWPHSSVWYIFMIAEAAYGE